MFIARAWIACSACSPRDSGAQSDLATVASTPTSFEVEVGTGHIDFQSLADGGDVELIHGPQGGWHVWTAFRLREVAIKNVRINLFARFEGGSAAGDPSAIAILLSDPTGGEQTYAGMRDFIHDGNQARGRKIILRVEVIASDGRHGAGERTVTAR